MQGQSLFNVIRPTQVRGVNASAVLRVLLAEGPASRSEIAQRLGLTNGPITRIVADLMGRGLLQECPSTELARPGRPRVPVAVVPGAQTMLGAHIAARNITCGLVEWSGRPIASSTADHDGSVEHCLQILDSLIDDALKGRRDDNLIGLGMTTTGWVDPVTGVVRRQSLLNWENVPLRELVEKRTGLTVQVDSAPRAHAAADLLYGTVAGAHNFIHVYVGHVIEIAQVVEGKVLRSADGHGGDIGDWTIDLGNRNSGPVRRSLTDSAIADAAQAAGVPDVKRNIQAVVTAAESGNADAIRLLDERALGLGRLLGHLNALMAPQAVVVSSAPGWLDLNKVEKGMLDICEAAHVPSLHDGNIWDDPLTVCSGALALENALEAL